MESSCDDLPTNLILVTSDSTVVGHCRLSLVNNVANAALIETGTFDYRLNVRF